MTDRSQLRRRLLRTRILMSLFLIAAGFFLLRVLRLWLGFDAAADTDDFDSAFAATFVLGLPALACWAHLKTLDDALSAEDEQPRQKDAG